MADQNNPKQVLRYSKPLNSLLRTSSEAEYPEYLSLKVVYEPAGVLSEEWKYQADGEVEEIHRYSYESGHLIQHHLEMPSEGIEEKFVTKRNADGKPVEIVKFYGDDPGERTVYEYGTAGQVTKTTNFDADGEFEQEEEMQTDENGRIIKRTVRLAAEPLRIYLYTYNEQGLVKLIEEQSEKGTVNSRHEYEYTVDGHEARMRHWNTGNKLISETVQEYSETGLLLRRLSKGFYTRLTSYTYDEKGNLTEEALSDENGFVISRNRYEYDDDNRLIAETVYETDLTRGGRDTHLSHRYDYEYFS